jgi:hypothetical protein
MKTGFDRVIHIAGDHTLLGCDPEPPTMRFRTLSGRTPTRGAAHRARRDHARAPRPTETPGQAHERRRVRCQAAHVRAKGALRELDRTIAAADRGCDELERRLDEAGARANAVRRRVVPSSSPTRPRRGP